MLLVRNPGGIQIASFSTNANGYKNIESQQPWDDYTEHDASRECVEIYRIMFDTAAVAGKTVLSAVAGIKRLVYGFRSGTSKVNNPSAVEPIEVFRKALLFPCPAVFQVAGQSSLVCSLSLDVQFYDAPIVANPVSNVYIATIEQDLAAATSFADEDIQFRVWYKWVKATQANQAAYLNWEALGV